MVGKSDRSESRMTAPSGYLRTLRESQASRRLLVAKALRERPDATNVELAQIFAVDRETIAEDRKFLMEQLTKNASSEMEMLRDELCAKLERLEGEVELHRKNGKLSLGAIDQLLSITKAFIELTGARKPVKEEVKVTTSRLIHFHGVPYGNISQPKPGEKLIDGETFHGDGSITGADGVLRLNGKPVLEGGK